MSWKEVVEELERRRQQALVQGGIDGINKQHAQGRLTIRERIDGLLDPGSFQEQGRATAVPDYSDPVNEQGTARELVPANYVLGFGKIDGRRVAVGGEDFTLKGGSPNPAGLRKSVYAEHMACHYKVPLVRLLEGGGGSVKGGGKPGANWGDPVFVEPRFKIIADALGQVPVVSAALGAVAGFPAGRLVASHFSVMARETAQIMTGGPALVERALRTKLSKAELGGAAIHARSGVVDNIADDEQDAFRQIRRFLGYLPSHVGESAPRVRCDDPVERMEQDLLNIVPRESNKAFNARVILDMVMDHDSVFELGAGFGRSQICALARLAGQPVGVLINNNKIYAGSMTAQAAQKYRRFVEMCDLFHLPVINFVDQPGFMIGLEAEKAGTIRFGMSAVAAAVQSVVPWAVVQIHKGFGVATAAHYAPNSYVLAWPSVQSGALPLEGGVAVAYRREIEAAADPDAKRRELEDALRGRRNPFARAESFSVHELIDPRETRPTLCQWIDWIQPLLETLKGPVRFGFRG